MTVRASAVTDKSYAYRTYVQPVDLFKVGEFMALAGVSGSVLLSAAPWVRARADVASTLALGVVVQGDFERTSGGFSPETGQFYLTHGGPALVPGHGYGDTPGIPIYLSQSTPGAGTVTAPTSGLVQQVGVTIDADNIFFFPYPAQVL
jgi:hypothetical protein